jgi:uncharacterized protein (UPF0147 family)
MDEEQRHEELEIFAEEVESLLEDMPLKPRERLEALVKEMRNNPDVDRLIKIQDELEDISNMQNVDSYTRNEIMNVITSLEPLINS